MLEMTVASFSEVTSSASLSTSVTFRPSPQLLGDIPIRALSLQEDGWPLGLQPLNVRVGMARNRDFSGSVSFSTLLTGSPTSSTASSSDLDTESTESFFHDESITLGSLIGVSSILQLSRRSLRGRATESMRDKKNCKSKTWFFSLCFKLDTDAISTNYAPSLGHFLEEERKPANVCRRTQSTNLYRLDDFSHVSVSNPNPLFIRSDIVAPPQSSSCSESDGRGRSNGG